MRTFILNIIVIVSTQTSFAQTSILATLPKQANNIESFIPKGYDTLGTAVGDLNKDGLADIALVLHHQKENDYKMEEEPLRLLLILFKNKNIYQLAASTDKAIMCVHCGGVFGDPFQGIIIEKNILTIQHYGGSSWRWSYNHDFKFQNNNFYLINRESNYYWNGRHCDKLKDFASTDYEKENFLTGNYEHKKISEDCKLLKDEKRKKAIKPLQKLSSFNIYK